MFVLAALIVAVVTYLFAAVVLHSKGGNAQLFALMSVLSLVIFVVLVVAFTQLSLMIGVDVGPGHPVSYSIPDDYLARGLVGVAVLMVLFLAGLAPIFGLGAALQRS